jgi:hypothetical protein
MMGLQQSARVGGSFGYAFNSVISRPGLRFGGDAPPKEVKTPLVKPVGVRAFVSQAFRTARNTLVMLLALVGGGQVYDAAIGDGPLPQMKQLSRVDPDLHQQALQNSTAELAWGGKRERTESEYWEALQPTLKILRTVSPEIAEWVESQRASGKLSYDLPSLHIEPVAAYHPILRTLYINHDHFWGLKDGEKAAVLAHEYRHARQNIPKVTSSRLTQLLSGRFFEYPCQLEDEAHLYEKALLEALGMSSYSAEDYLSQRNLHHSH